jgi:hypothetical protein
MSHSISTAAPAIFHDCDLHADILSAAPVADGSVEIFIKDSVNVIGGISYCSLTPEDAAALGAQLIDIAFKQGALSTEVMRDYSSALFNDAFNQSIKELSDDLYNDGNGVG